MNEALRQHYLQAMGIVSWHERDAGAPVSIDSRCTTPESMQDSGGWNSLAEAVRQCTKCPLHKSRTQTVFGIGDPHAKLLIVGEAPGESEDRLGEPFVGRAGKLLDKMLQAIGLNRQAVYIANVLKCRPPSNRDPLPEEVAKCTPYLEQQIALLEPQLILAVGRIAAHHLLGLDLSLSRLRGQTYKFGSTPLLVTYHPAYLLRNPRDKSKAFQDLQQVQQLLQLESTLDEKN